MNFLFFWINIYYLNFYIKTENFKNNIIKIYFIYILKCASSNEKKCNKIRGMKGILIFKYQLRLPWLLTWGLWLLMTSNYNNTNMYIWTWLCDWCIQIIDLRALCLQKIDLRATCLCGVWTIWIMTYTWEFMFTKHFCLLNIYQTYCFGSLNLVKAHSFS